MERRRRPAELHKFTWPVRINSHMIDQSTLHMFWYCVLMCRIQYGDEAPYQLADGEVFITPKPGGSGPDSMRFINLLDSTGKLRFGYWLSYVFGPIHTLDVRFH